MPFSRGGSRYSVNDLSSAWIQDLDLMVRLSRRPWMVISLTRTLLSATAFRSTCSRMRSAAGAWDDDCASMTDMLPQAGPMQSIAMIADPTALRLRRTDLPLAKPGRREGA